MRNNFIYTPSIVIYKIYLFYGIHVRICNLDNKPSKRRMLSMCVADNKVYIFGGVLVAGNAFSRHITQYLNDMYYIDMNIENPNWIEIDRTETTDNIDWPCKRWSHTMNYYDNNIYLIGGSNDTLMYLYVWKYSTIINKWESIEYSDENIPILNKHTSCLYKHYIILFGGTQYNGMRCNDTYVFDIKSEKIFKIECNNKPQKRKRHSMTIINDKIIIYGGLDKHEQALNDLYTINVSDIINNNKPLWIKLDINMPYLYAHNMLSFNNKLIIIGGKDKLGKQGILNDKLIIFNDNDLTKYKTCKINKKYQRYQQQSCIITINNIKCIFLVSGVNADINECNDSIIIYIE